MLELLDNPKTRNALLDEILADSRRCLASKGYPDETRARLTANSMKRAGTQATVRKCGVCGRWHVERWI